MPDENFDELMEKRDAHNGVLYKAAPKPPRTVGERSAIFVMSAQGVDRHGDVVVTSGIDTTDFQKNPVVLLNHRSWDMPLGSWHDVEAKPKSLEGRAQFADEGVSAESDTAWKLVAAGILRGASIGFYPRAYECMEDPDGRFTGFKITESELIECSVVTIPANSAALVKALDRGIKIETMKAFAESALDCWMPGPDGAVMPRADAEKMWREIGEKAGVSVFPVTAPETKTLTLEIESDGVAEVMKREGDTIIDRVSGLLRKAGLIRDEEIPAQPVKGGRIRARAMEADLSEKMDGVL